MANTVSNSISLFAQGAMSAFRQLLHPVTTFSTNFSPNEGQVGQAVQVNLYNDAGSARNWGGEYTIDDQTISAVTVNLDKWAYKAVHATDKEIADQGVDLYKLGEQAGVPVARYVVTGAMNVINTGTYGLPVMTLGGAANMAMSGLYAGRARAAVWGPNRNAIITPEYFGGLLNNLPNSDSIQTEGAREGSIGRLAGFNLWENNVSPLAGNSQSKIVFASPDAVAIASRALPPDTSTPGGADVQYEVVTDPQTKVTLTAVSYYEPSKRRRVYAVNWLGGWAVGNPSGAAVLYGG